MADTDATKAVGPATEPKTTSRFAALSRWAKIALAILSVIVLAFAVRLLSSNQSLVGSVHQRNFHNLDVAAKALEDWPGNIRQVAMTSIVFDADDGAKDGIVDRYHPDIGTYDIEYDKSCKKGDAAEKVFDQGIKPGQGMIFNVKGQLVDAAKSAPSAVAPLGMFAAPAAAPATAGTCFKVSVPLARLVNLGKAAPDFSHLLILASDGTIVAQLGETTLPVNRIKEFSPTTQIASEIARVAAGGKLLADEVKPVALGDADGVVRKRIAGASYRVYVKPFKVGDRTEACPAQTVTKPGVALSTSEQPVVTPPAAVPPSAIPASGYCYAVGLMPESRLTSAWLSPPPFALVWFGLALVAFIALLPLLRLLLIGAAESLSPIETAGAVIGVQGAAAIATLAVLFAAEALAERKAADSSTAAVAQRMQVQADREIGAAITTTLAHRIGRTTIGWELRGPAAKCLTDPERPQVRDCPSQQPAAVESMHFVSAKGEVANLTPVLAFHPRVVSAISVRYRDYFRALMHGETHGWTPSNDRIVSDNAYCNPARPGVPIRYAVGQVRAQTDGSAKTVLAFDCASSGVPAVPEAQYLLAATVLRSFVAPVLPDPLKFVVVDLNEPRLPVLFHHNRYREGSEYFADRVQGGAAHMAALRALSHDSDPIDMTLNYDGQRSHFIAHPLKRAHWAVLVYYERDAIDQIAATSASRALVDWFSLALFAFAVAALRLVVRPDRWRDVWPDEAEHDMYGTMAKRLVLAAAVLSLPLVLMLAMGVPGWVALVVALFGWVASVLYFNVGLSERPRSAKPLSPHTERDYGRLFLAMLLCMSVVPMVAIWADARIFSLEQSDTRRAVAAADAIAERHDRISAIARTLKTPPAPSDPLYWKEGLPETKIDNAATLEPPDRPASFARTLWESQFGTPPTGWQVCPPQTNPRRWLCFEPGIATTDRDSVRDAMGIARHQTDWSLSLWTWVGLAIFAGALGTAIVAAVNAGLKALMGFGVPLGAIKFKPIDLNDIASRTLLVAPQQPVRQYLNSRDDPWKVDLADLFLTTRETDLNDQATKQRFEQLLHEEMVEEGTAPKRLIATGLSLILRDAARRRAALKFLETADRALDAGRIDSLLIVSEFSPLERILDAFDSEELGDKGATSSREELRWARLFQRFTTHSFTPIDKIDMRRKEIDKLKHKHSIMIAAIDRWRNNHPRVATATAALRARSAPVQWIAKFSRQRFSLSPKDNAIHTLIDEMRWLPGSIIDSVLPRALQKAPLTTPDGKVPIDEKLYQDHYTNRVLAWAREVDAPSEPAAIDHLRSTLIEHYEQCWAASTHSERLVLDAIARGQFVNMLSAIALQSLVRRGLVILDPAPRLMNRSFAQFVRQAERPNTLRHWRSLQPKSSWAVARMPLIAIGLVAAAVLAAGAAESGQHVTALFSLLVAGGPALLNTLFRAVRPAG